MSVDGPVAVIDLGSNSGRLVVYARQLSGQLEILEDARVPLRLAKDLQSGPNLSDEAFERSFDALRDFQAIARGAGAQRTILVGTAAMREAANGSELIDRIRADLGLELELIDGLGEARYAFLGAVHSLPVSNGFILDIGGGSLEVSRFRDRRAIAAWSLPLGALRTSGEFLKNDPPSGKELRHLRRHVRKSLEAAGLPSFDSDDVFIGTGGTIRNIAKIDRRSRSYPIPRLHGYVIPIERVRAVANRLAGRSTGERAATPGLNADRADSIIGGALTVAITMELLGARELQVSGMGLREGIALATMNDEPPAPDDVRRASVAALTSRFRGWDPRRAERRRQLLSHLLETLEPDASCEFKEAADYAATVLDIGRSVDYYNRLSHTASIITVAGLGGFSHRGIALLAALIYEADRKQVDLRLFAPLLQDGDLMPIARTGVLLAIADELERRYPNDEPVVLAIRVDDGVVALGSPPISQSQAAKLSDRFERTFERRLTFKHEGG